MRIVIRWVDGSTTELHNAGDVGVNPAGQLIVKHLDGRPLAMLSVNQGSLLYPDNDTIVGLASTPLVR